VRRRITLAVVALCAIGVAVVSAPLALRQVRFFGVRQVELVGLRYLAPEQVLATLRLAPDRHLFDPLGEVERRAEAIPGVERVSVTRRLPGTLRLTFVERVPVAFAPGPAGLVPLDADARPMPYDPALTGFDLPVLDRPDSVLVQALAQVRVADSVLFQRVDAARRGRGGMVVLELGMRQLLLQPMPTIDEIRAVETVRRHLVRSGRAFDALDARFAGWVVVRRGRA
jgi:cell division protein FtsQ